MQKAALICYKYFCNKGKIYNVLNETDFWRSLIRVTIYSFYNPSPPAPSVVMNEKLNEISAGTSYEFPHGQTALYHLLKKLSFEHQKIDNWKAIMETPRIVAWSWEDLQKVEDFWAESYVLAYWGET